ncbi:MAG: S-methyl-5-thioribose-1-phosphate isomerase [Mariprofundaceae bacterium]|nr:S-methyl-5-thioribose-1-phosphate isomerase [Mariprofundaceae bacterium]
MNIGGKHCRAVAWNAASKCPRWLNQCALPFAVIWRESCKPEVIAQAIETMEVRGAPCIGAFAAFGLALAYAKHPNDFINHWLPRFRATRPTAVNLFHACDYMEAFARSHTATPQTMVEAACHYADQEVASNRAIGTHLAEKLAVGERRILTHCNAGWLAAVDWGTALSGIYQLHRQGEKPFVWVDETRPRLQGARLTAWELMQEGVDCCLQADVAAAWMMAQGKVDAIVTGADRIAANGDVANKIGTYALALAAKAHGIPFYIAAPRSTMDADCAHGQAIPIEQRSDYEVTHAQVLNSEGNIEEAMIAAPGICANNPAFDVTPYDYITAIVCEDGIWEP